MKKWKIAGIVFVISICTVSFFTGFADDAQNKLVNWAYSLGAGIKNISEKPNSLKSSDIVSYVNDIPVYEDEILDRIEKNKAILNSMKTVNNSASLSWGSNPLDYVYKEKFLLNYAKTNGIEVTKEELEEYISCQRAQWELEDSKEMFEQYLIGRGITKEEFFNDVAPPSYEKTMIKNKVRKHILEKAGMNDKDYEEKQKYLEAFYQENIKVKEIDKDFIKMYDKEW